MDDPVAVAGIDEAERGGTADEDLIAGLQETGRRRQTLITADHHDVRWDAGNRDVVGARGYHVKSPTGQI